MKVKREDFIRYLRDQADVLNEMADAFEDGEKDPEVVLSLKLEKAFEYENGGM
ncbi:hypothetical protein [Brevibacillus sp. NRS-1366]|uniref:hypothetical protein n=1 Tax=Brevibacillus sp. NRS-1366 TaxID=3233899 RepID=UPI003D1C00AD